jgi:hypothetical protein
MVASSAAAEEAKPAAWKVREVSFSYRSSNAIYSCSALQARVHSIFLAVGAREDLKVRVSSCSELLLDDEFELSRDPRERRSEWDRRRGWDGRSHPGSNERLWEDPYERFQNRATKREQNAYVHVDLMLPVEVTREVLGEIERDKSRRELVSRVTGDPSAKLNDPLLFAATWQPVTLSGESLELKPEECELIEQMMSVFKELGLRVIQRSRRCSIHGLSRTPPTLTVQALLAAPIGATSLPQIPSGETVSEPSASSESQ